MTVQELYDWACENDAKDLEVESTKYISPTIVRTLYSDGDSKEEVRLL